MAPSKGIDDLDRLGSWLSDNINDFGTLESAEKFAGGQSNPTYLLKATSGKYVLRAKPQGELLKGAHAVDREYQVIDALKDTGVPVAKPYALCTDETIIGSMFYVMEFMEGRVFWDPRLPELDNNEERTAIYNEMNRVLAAMHSVNVNDIGLGDFGKTTDYYARQIHIWTRQYRGAETDHISSVENLIKWLPENIPDGADSDDQVALVHGDYRLDNMIFHPTEPRVIALVDWELSTLGNPIADLAYQCAQWRLPNLPMLRSFGDEDRTQFGVPSEEDYIASYCAARGVDKIDHWNFYLSFSLFRLTSIIQGVKKRSELGNASSEQAKLIGNKVTEIADYAWAIAQKED